MTPTMPMHLSTKREYFLLGSDGTAAPTGEDDVHQRRLLYFERP